MVCVAPATGGAWTCTGSGGQELPCALGSGALGPDSWRDVLSKSQPASSRTIPPPPGDVGGAAAATQVQGADSGGGAFAFAWSAPPPPVLDAATALRISRGLPAVALADAADVRGAAGDGAAAPRNGTDGDARRGPAMFDISTTMGVVMAFIMLTIAALIAVNVVARCWLRRQQRALSRQASAEVGLLGSAPSSGQSDASVLDVVVLDDAAAAGTGGAAGTPPAAPAAPAAPAGLRRRHTHAVAGRARRAMRGRRSPASSQLGDPRQHRRRRRRQRH
ncbi:hypothetical protein HXX76_011545 [Chlamydomonas incerta]|uniref:Uncharacterized protein n=1 Tax=Chlamydomonas incerta TaxID=51695 RepID=A0A835VUJ1_CHLIN|nr:hypothetical protein HXX76_011545 [Chlamydomonas incerta]|eukprot:KAG2428425.1 hypothetical protein HXX76_011545 [Chlamydomonas incerta]